VVEEIVAAATVVNKNHHRDGQAPVSSDENEMVKSKRIKKTDSLLFELS
jgi:hypothetical protein